MAQGRVQRCVLCLVPPLDCQEESSFTSATFACLVRSPVLFWLKMPPRPYWLVIVCAVIFSCAPTGWCEANQEVIKAQSLICRPEFVDASWRDICMFAISFQFRFATSFPPVAASHLSHVFVAAFSRSFLQLHLQVAFLCFVQYTTCLVLLSTLNAFQRCCVKCNFK